MGGNELAAQAGEAAMLCKADLLTDMVGEFPELQGIMGRYYAKHDGLSDDVADAIEDHYKPRFAGDELPRNLTGISVALADKLETLVGMFGIGQIPTGDKDPFALRRHALGVIRILIEQEVPLPLDTLLREAENVFNRRINDTSETLNRFIYERLRHYFSIESFDEQALESSKRVYVEPADRIFSPQQIDAVLALRPQMLHDVKKRLYAVRAFAALPEAESLAATNKRVGNIPKSRCKYKRRGGRRAVTSACGTGLVPRVERHCARGREGIQRRRLQYILADTGWTEGPSGRFFRSRHGQHRG